MSWSKTWNIVACFWLHKQTLHGWFNLSVNMKLNAMIWPPKKKRPCRNFMEMWYYHNELYYETAHLGFRCSLFSLNQITAACALLYVNGLNHTALLHQQECKHGALHVVLAWWRSAHYTLWSCKPRERSRTVSSACFLPLAQPVPCT